MYVTKSWGRACAVSYNVHVIIKHVNITASSELVTSHIVQAISTIEFHFKNRYKQSSLLGAFLLCSTEVRSKKESQKHNPNSDHGLEGECVRVDKTGEQDADGLT